MGDQMINAPFNAAQETATRLNNVLARNAQRNTDDLFARMAVESGSTAAYNKDDYVRLSFDSKKDAALFANDMGGQGVNVNVAPVKLNGQWLVELSKENTVYSGGEEKTISANELIDDYVQTSGKQVYEARDYNTEKASSTVEEESKELGTFLENNLDDLGKAITGIQKLANLADEYGANANNQIFKDTKGQFDPKRMQTATVINGDTVIINGKIATGKERDYVLKQQEERMHKALTILYGEKGNKAILNHESKEYQTMCRNAQKIQDNIFVEQEYVSRDAKIRGGRDGGALDKYVEMFNIGAIAGVGKEADFLNAIKGDLGIKVPLKGFNGKDVLNCNQAFFDAARAKGLNIAFIDKHGKFDVNALKFPAVKQAFSKETLEFMEKLNTKGAWGGMNIGNSLLMKGTMKLADDEDMQKMVQGATKTVKYTKQASTTVHQFKSTIQNTRDIQKTKKTDFNKDNSKLNKIKENASKAKKPLDPETAAKQEKKFIEKKNRLEKKLQRSKKSPFAWGRKMYDRSVGRIMQSRPAQALGKANAALTAFLVKAAVFVLLGTILVGTIIVLGLALLCLIEALINFVTGFVKYLPSYFNKSAAYHLVKKLKKEELNWINGVEKFDSDIFFKTDEMSFGTDKQKLEDYVNNFDGELVYMGGGTLAVNPFYKLCGTVNFDDYLAENEIPIINGDLTVGYSSNLNSYGYRGLASDGSYVATESGHTSNIKDIIAMTDVMFNLEMSENSDDKLENVLGETPFKLKCKEIWNNVKGFFKAVGHNIATFFKKLFGGGEEDEYITVEDANGGKQISYGTLQTYAVHLFTYSHTNQVDLNVSYYPVGKLELNINGETKEWTGANFAEASALGVCTSPVKNSFKIFYDTAKHSVAPYLESDTGTKYNLSTYDFGTINVHLNDFVPKNEDDKLCLKSDFGSNVRTWEYINGIASLETPAAETSSTPNDASDTSSDSEAVESDTCWTKTSESKVTTVTVMGTTGSENDEDSGYYTTKEDALKAAKAKYDESLASAKATFKALTDSYVLSTDWNKFTATRYVSNFDAAEADTEPIVISDDLTTLGANSAASDVNSNAVYGKLTVSYTSKTINSVTKYKATVACTAYSIFNETFTRDCKGHDFEYCGGHVGVNSQGVVYSMTNEQMALGAAYNSDDEKPVVKDFDFEGHGYESLQGKHNLDKVDFSTAPSASTTGGCPLPTESVQGSNVANRGLNLYVDEDGTFKSGYYVREDIPSTLVRDIFDIDCMIDKGGNAFPWGSHYEDYEGWCEDNMSLALSRTTIDWLDTYGTDVNIELDRKTKDNEEISGISTTTDLNNIIESLRATYGDDLTEEREAAVRLALSWVGRGHYNEHHKDHAFLSELCASANNATIKNSDGTISTISYDANCTASDDEGFVKFILNRMGEFVDNTISLSKHNNWSDYGGVDDLLPADILLHKVADNVDYTDLELKSLPKNDDINYVRDVLQAYTDERYVFVVGVLGQDVTIQNRAVLLAGTLLTIDLQLYDNIGTIRLHVGTADGWEDVGYVTTKFKVEIKDEDDDKSKEQTISCTFMKNYYWITHPDVFTKRMRAFMPPYVV